jgi:phage terminase large subunit-like protein
MSKYYYDEKEAKRAVAFIETMIRHCKGDLAGKLLKLEEWQKTDIIEPLFGWKNKETNLRKYRTCYVEIPRKNGKSTLGASIGLYMLFADNERGAEVFSCAGDRSQASIIFNLAKSMIEMSPELLTRSKLYRSSIEFPAKGNIYKVLSSDAKLQHGHNAHAVLFDELHTQPNDELWNTMITSTGARSQPLIMAITTAGASKTDNNICWQVHDYAQKVKDGIIEDESFLPVIYSADEDDDIEDEKTWIKANPNYGISIKKEYFEKESAKAMQMPSYENSFKRLHLNIWTTNVTKWISDQQWMENYEDFDIKQLEGKECYAGLDLASVRDMSALVLLFPMDDEKYVVLPFFWCPWESIYNRTMKDKLNYNQWVNEGHLIATEGDVQDYEYIRQTINELHQKYNIKSIGYDRWNSSSLVINLLGDGLTMSPFGQGWASMSAPTKELEKLILKKQINHLNNPIMRWMMSNVALRTDPAENIKVDKAKSSEKVDGIVSLVMAIGEKLTDESPGQSIYNERGLLIL